MKEVSKNKEAERIVGLRKTGGTPINLPCEMDYCCPICHRTCKYCSGEKEKGIEHHWDESLQFSEYNCFMYCPNCNIDIPSLLCLRANTKRAVEIYTERFLEMVEEIKKEASQKTAEAIFADFDKVNLGQFSIGDKEKLKQKYLGTKAEKGKVSE